MSHPGRLPGTHHTFAPLRRLRRVQCRVRESSPRPRYLRPCSPKTAGRRPEQEAPEGGASCCRHDQDETGRLSHPKFLAQPGPLARSLQKNGATRHRLLGSLPAALPAVKMGERRRARDSGGSLQHHGCMAPSATATTACLALHRRGRRASSAATGTRHQEQPAAEAPRKAGSGLAMQDLCVSPADVWRTSGRRQKK